MMGMMVENDLFVGGRLNQIRLLKQDVVLLVMKIACAIAVGKIANGSAEEKVNFILPKTE